MMRLGTYTVVAGELVSVGYGNLDGQENAQGRIYLDLKDNATTPLEVNGVVRLSVYSPQDRPIEIISEMRTETLRTSSSDRTKQISFPEHDLMVKEDKKIVLEFIPDANATISKANSTLIMDITKFTV
jgi:hypothetical protein